MRQSTTKILEIHKNFHLNKRSPSHPRTITSLSWSPNGKFLASAAINGNFRVWDGKFLNSIWSFADEGPIFSLTWSPCNRFFATASQNTIDIWSPLAKELIFRYESDLDIIFNLSWSPNGRYISVCAFDTSVFIFDLWEGDLYNKSIGDDWILKAEWSPDSERLACCSLDNTIRIINIYKKDQVAVLDRHKDGVLSLKWSRDCTYLVSSSRDQTICIWDTIKNELHHVIEGHTGAVNVVSLSNDDLLLASQSDDQTIKFWRCDTWELVATLNVDFVFQSWLNPIAFHPNMPQIATIGSKERFIQIWTIDISSLLETSDRKASIQYVHAKVVLLGDSGVGKTGLGIRLAENKFRHTSGSTHGAQFWYIPVSFKDNGIEKAKTKISHEICLWDLAGQPDYHIVHQLFLDGTDAALLLFDCSDPFKPFKGVPYWAKVLNKQSPKHSIKVLVSSRCDVCSPTVDITEINKILAEFSLVCYCKTSAATGEGIKDLLYNLVNYIPWDKIARTTSPELFLLIKNILLEIKESGKEIISLENLVNIISENYKEGKPDPKSINTVIALHKSRGFIYTLESARGETYILLKPELLNQYASSIIQAARNHPKGIGAILERDVLNAAIPFSGFQRLNYFVEKVILETTIELLIKRELCIRELGYLIFPSQIKIKKTVQEKIRPPTEITYSFSGSIEAIYASLVVRLSYTDYFRLENQWRYSSEFSKEGEALGFYMEQVEEGTADLGIYFSQKITDFDRVIFIRFITDHLATKGLDLKKHIHLYCSNCEREIENLEAIMVRVESGYLDIPCQYCSNDVIIPKSIEERYSRDKSYMAVKEGLSDIADKRSQKEAKEFIIDSREYSKGDIKDMLRILHISDIHIKSEKEAKVYRSQLETDLKKELKINRLDYMVISGDIANYSNVDDYNAAFDFIDGIVKHFGLDSSRIIIVPGNHDLSWDSSEDAYLFYPKRKLLASPPEDLIIPAGEAGALIRDDEKYPERFRNFSNFYKRLHGSDDYPLDPDKQGLVYFHTNDSILFLTLNSSWEVDHYFTKRISINTEALANALDQIRKDKYDKWLKIAVWHHPLTGSEGIKNHHFIQQLAVNGFKVVLHGHIHEASEGFYKYDNNRNVHLVGAGTFGAPIRQQTPGIPLQYNLLSFDQTQSTICVETRKKEKVEGAWSADSRWGDKNNPAPRYCLDLKN